MKRNIWLSLSVSLFVAFAAWTAAVVLVDTAAIGPGGSVVGLSTLNGRMRELIGVRLTLYHITDWLGLVPIAVALGFAALGLCEWIKLRSIKKVDKRLLLLGAFYIATAAAYAFFEVVVINCRPVLIDGFLEASYPSSTTLLVTCVMPTAIMQLSFRIKSKPLMLTLNCVLAAFCVFMVVGRILSGVHWLSDIVGGLLLSGALVCAYRYFERKC